MANLAVVDDKQLELAVLVDTDTWQAFGVVAMGPDRVTLLTSFADRVPIDLESINPPTLREWFAQFLTDAGALPEAQTAEADQSAPVADNGTGDDAASALATREATEAGDTPATQPADTDMEADQSTQTVQVRCWNCNGSGFIEFGDGEPSAQCGICKGSGRVTTQVEA